MWSILKHSLEIVLKNSLQSKTMSSADSVKDLAFGRHNSSLMMITRILCANPGGTLGGQKSKDPRSGYVAAKPSPELRIYFI